VTSPLAGKYPATRADHLATTLRSTSRRLAWPDCNNTRDLGGLPRAGGLTRTGVLVRSDSVSHLTPAGREAMTAYGVTTVIDLRTGSELLTSPNPFADGAGPAYVSRPLIDDSMMVKLGDAIDMYGRYLMMLDHRQEAFCDIFTSVAEADGAILFHCFAGKDRTGLVAALLLSLAGVEPDAIAADFAETDAQLAAKYQEWLAAAEPDRRKAMREDLQCPPERMLAVLDHIETRWGGVAAYLEASGVSLSNIDRVASRLD
jgi:protein-tyrosine phosphatase